MFSTLLVVTTLIGSQIVLASDSPAAAQVDTLKTDESTPVNRQSRQFWLPPPNPYVGQYFYGQNWPSPIPYSPEFRRQHTSSGDLFPQKFHVDPLIFKFHSSCEIRFRKKILNKQFCIIYITIYILVIYSG